MARLTPGDVVAGPPLAKCREQLPAGVIVADERFWEPMALPVGDSALNNSNAAATSNPLELVPHYYRRSAAEEKAAKS